MGFDFDAAVTAPFRMQPGLRRMAAGECHLTPSVAPNRGVARHLREKLAVFSSFAASALLARLGFDAGPCVDTLARHAAVEQPAAFALDGARLTARWLGWSIDANDEPHSIDTAWPEVGACLAALPAPWRMAALLSLGVEEDFAIVDGNDGTIPWLAVALPSHWAPEQRQAIFTIQIDVQPLAAALADRAHAARVHDALASMSDEVLDYRGLRPVRDPLLRWLSARRAPPAQ